MKNDKIEIKEKELDAVNGGVIPIIYAAESKAPVVEPLVEKNENKETKEEKNAFVPIPYYN